MGFRESRAYPSVEMDVVVVKTIKFGRLERNSFGYADVAIPIGGVEGDSYL